MATNGALDPTNRLLLNELQQDARLSLAELGPSDPFNTAVLISSSFTMHWALEGARNENRNAMRVGLLTTFLLGLTFLTVQVNEYVHLGFAPHDHAQGTIFYGLTGLHGAHEQHERGENAHHDGHVEQEAERLPL